MIKLASLSLPVVFVGGPYSQPDPSVNVNATAKLVDKLWQDGFVFPICPMIESHIQHLIVPRDYDAWLLRCMRYIHFADAGIFRFGPSSGKVKEQSIFTELNKPFWDYENIDHAIGSLYRWVDTVYKVEQSRK